MGWSDEKPGGGGCWSKNRGLKKLKSVFVPPQGSTMTAGPPPPAENCPVNGMVVVTSYGYDRGELVAPFLNVISPLMRKGGLSQ